MQDPRVLLCAATAAALAWASRAQEPPIAGANRDPFALVRAAHTGGHRMLLRQFRCDEPALGERHDAGRRTALERYQDQQDLPAAHWIWVRRSAAPADGGAAEVQARAAALEARSQRLEAELQRVRAELTELQQRQPPAGR